MAIQYLPIDYILQGNETDEGSYPTILITKEQSGDGQSGLYAFFKTFTGTSSLLITFPNAFANIIPYNVSWAIPQEYLYEAGGWTLCPFQYVLNFFRTEANQPVFEIKLSSLLSFSTRDYNGRNEAYSVIWRFTEKDSYVTRSMPFPVFNEKKNEPDFILFDVMAVIPEDLTSLLNYIGNDSLCDTPCISFSARGGQDMEKVLPLINFYPVHVNTTCISYAPSDFVYLDKLVFPRTQWVQKKESFTYYMINYTYVYWGTISTKNYNNLKTVSL